METYSVWGVVLCHSCAFEQKSHCLWVLALALAECVHQLLELCRALDLEEDFVVVICNLDIQMFGLFSLRRSAVGRSLLVLVGHDGVKKKIRKWRYGKV